MASNIYWAGPVVLVLLRLLYLEARSARASSSGSMIVFRAALSARLLFIFGISVMLILLVKDARYESPWIVAGGMVFILLLCLGWPSTITVDSAGVTRYVWWKPKLTIPWNAVTDLEKGSQGDLTVYSSDGKALEFSRYHVDPHRFEAEVLKRGNLGQPTAPHSLTTLQL